MDRDELIFREYKTYCEQKENFIDRNFNTNKFYIVVTIALIFALIYTGNVVFLGKISATLVFALLGISVTALWWMNVDSYNTLIKIKYMNVIEKIEEKLPIKPFTDEYKGIEDFRDNRIFMFSDIQKFIAVCVSLFFFAVAVSEITPLLVSLYSFLVDCIHKLKSLI